MADIDIERDGSVLEIRFNRPDKRNSVTNAMYKSLIEALQLLEGDDDLAVGLLTGEGSDFCAGNDIGDFVAPRDEPLAAGALISLLPGVTKPLVAGVRGRAIGIGATILLHCDLVYVGTDADLRFPFIDLGVVPEAASTRLLPRLAGRVRSAQALLLGRPLTATQAVEWGIANEAVDPEQVRATALDAARTLASKPPMALAATKALLRGDTELLAQRIATELAVFEEMLTGPEFAAAADRFLNRR